MILLQWRIQGVGSRVYEMISKDHVYSQIELSGKLPTLPEILLRLLAACDDRDSSISDIADIICKDPALSLRVLQLVNSAYYGFRHCFSGIESAVVYLGANTIRNLAVTTSVHQVFEQKKGNGAAQFETGAFWRHSLMCATIAKRISLETGAGNADEAYLSGLLHDIGKLLLQSAFPHTYMINPLTVLTGPEELRLESDQAGVNHSEAGSWLVRQWSLGSLVADALMYHHESLDQVSEAFPLVKIVYMANILAKGSLETGQIDEIGGTLFGIDHHGFADCVGNASEEVDQIASSMGIKISPPHALSSGSAGDGDCRAGQHGERDSERSGQLEDMSDADLSIRTAIASRVKNMSLLSTFQEELMQAEESQAILAAFEKTMAILMDINKVLFFLPDREGILLCGRTSANSGLLSISRGLTFPVRQSASLIVRAFQGKTRPEYLVRDRQGASIADQQLLAMFNCVRAEVIPLVVGDAAVGVIVIGLPDTRAVLNEEDSQLLGILAQQVALRLHLEQEKERKARVINKERMDAISMTARKLAHEINNPLGIIGNYLVTLKMKLSGEHNVLDELGIIDEEIQRISAMVGQMEMYSQAPFSEFLPLDINVTVRDVIQIAKPSLFAGPGLSVSFIPGADVPHITTSKDALKQILINLLKNAAEAMPEGGRTIVRTRKGLREERGGQGGVEIIVADSGPGLPDTVRENLYKPFVTTKQSGHSGLGLSIVQKAVNDIGGTLSCVSSRTEGTTFTIYLPGTLPDGPK